MDWERGEVAIIKTAFLVGVHKVACIGMGHEQDGWVGGIGGWRLLFCSILSNLVLAVLCLHLGGGFGRVVATDHVFMYIILLLELCIFVCLKEGLCCSAGKAMGLGVHIMGHKEIAGRDACVAVCCVELMVLSQNVLI